jgi:alkylated DNA repair dioxygenase AlkB
VAQVTPVDWLLSDRERRTDEGMNTNIDTLFTPSPSAGRTFHLSQRSWVRHEPGWAASADRLYESLVGELAWRRESLQLYGREVLQPRLTAVCGRSMSPASRYRAPNPAAPWTATAEVVLDAVADDVPGWVPNGLIANLYRDGQDSIAWHADDEPALGPNPVVVSVSLGATRTCRFRRRGGGPTVAALDLADGDLVVMGGHTQAEFEHAINKTRRVDGPRLSLTFRRYS